MASITYFPNSSNIESITWLDSADALLGVKFTSGTLYHTGAPVPKSVVVEWIAAESAGKFFHEKVRGVYELEKVQDGNELP